MTTDAITRKQALAQIPGGTKKRSGPRDRVTKGERIMATRNVFRIQPQGADLHGIRTETSNGDLAGGVHVFETIAEIEACSGWIEEENVEVATIECDERDIRPNSDYEGALLIAGRGKIVDRQAFTDTRAVAQWARENSES